MRVTCLGCTQVGGRGSLIKAKILIKSIVILDDHISPIGICVDFQSLQILNTIGTYPIAQKKVYQFKLLI